MSFQPPPGNPPPPSSGGWQPPAPPTGGYGPPPAPPPAWAAPPPAGAAPAPWGPPPAAPKRSRKGLVIGLGIAGAVVLLLVAVGAATVANRVSGGTALADLQRGQCFNTAKALVAEKANRVDCARLHSDEVAGILRFPAASGASYPGQQGILDFGRRDCVTQAREFLGPKSLPATAQLFVFGPNKPAWKNGDRTVVCSLRESSAAKRTGSYLTG